MVAAGGAARRSSRERVSQVVGLPLQTSLRERLHPNKRLKLSAPAGAGWRCRLGRRACHKEVVDFTRCGALRRSLSAGTLGSSVRQPIRRHGSQVVLPGLQLPARFADGRRSRAEAAPVGRPARGLSRGRGIMTKAIQGARLARTRVVAGGAAQDPVPRAEQGLPGGRSGGLQALSGKAACLTSA